MQGRHGREGFVSIGSYKKRSKKFWVRYWTLLGSNLLWRHLQQNKMSFSFLPKMKGKNIFIFE
jgi:hypothetical protein